MNNKLWIVIAVAISIFAYFFVDLWLQTPLLENTKKSDLVASQQNDSENVAEIEIIELLDDSKLEADAGQLEATFQQAIKKSKLIKTSTYPHATERLLKEHNIVSPWTAIDPSIVEGDVHLRKDVKPVQFIKLNTKALQSLHNGDQFDFPAFSNKQYSMTVLKSKTLWNGDVVISGTVQSGDDNNSFPAVISTGKNATFASFSTPEGSYELESFGQIGALYSVTEMDQQAFYPETDELLN